MPTDKKAVPAQESGSHLHSPPDSTGSRSKESPVHKHEGSDSELSDIEDPEEDIGEVVPDHWADEDRVPVFKPTVEQFKSFPRYMKKINPYGMKSGIVKVIPPEPWKNGLPKLDEAIKTIRVREPIKQDIMGTGGTYRQANILHQRSYNLPQWRQLCEQSEHQPPAKRGERRLNQDKPAPPRAAPKTRAATGGRKTRGRPFKGKGKAAKAESDGLATPDRLPTPVSPTIKPEDDGDSIRSDGDDDMEPAPKRIKGGRGGRGGGRGGQTISVSSRRKYIRKDNTARVDEEAFKDFQYELDVSEYTAERCEELERAYWKTLTYAPPLYGADMPGSLFDDSTTTWNLGKLENILDVLGTKIPGVNTAYLYLGMWKATFAWHLEDVDLYSINYLHFGAPKQWYSISQGDARKFEAAMKTIWPTDAKACDQFLRHKTFLISPAHLLSNFNIKVNKIVCYPGEFVITFPYGYHSGYNLGYNCAEAVNFALDSWLEYGRVAKKCDCDQAQDSVWIDVREIDRKLRGEETEFEETEDEEEEEDEDEDGPNDLPTPPQSTGDIKIKIKAPKKKRKRPVNEKVDTSSSKRIRVRIKMPAKEPCILCPNDIPSEPLLPTEDGEKAHRMCALYIPETNIDSGLTDVVTDVKYINKARLDLKCNYCRSKKGACFQCSQKKCVRAYHATCAAAAGVFVEQGEIPVFGEDGTEYKEWGIEFSCRFHRTKRDKKLEANDLSENARVLSAAAALKIGDTCQLQYWKGDIFAGSVVENRKSEEMLLIDILPRGDRVEVEYKWLLVPDAADYRLQKPSASAIPMPKSFKAKESLNTSKRQADDLPRADDPFLDGFTWAEFKSEEPPANPHQVKVSLKKEDQIWYYLGKNSTEAKAQFTEDPAKRIHNPKGHFLDTIPKPVVAIPRQSYAASYPTIQTHAIQQHASNTAKGNNRLVQPAPLSSAARQDKPYVYTPRNDFDDYRVDPQAYRSQQNFVQRAQPPPIQFGTDPRWAGAHSSSPATPYQSTASVAYRPSSHNTNAMVKAPYASPVSYTSTYNPSYNAAAKAQNSSTRKNSISNTPYNSAAKKQQAPSAPQYTGMAKPQQPSVQYTPMAKAPYAAPPRASHPMSYAQNAGASQLPRGPLAPPAQYNTPPHMQQPAKPLPMNPFSNRPQSSTKANPFKVYAYLQKEHNRSPLEYKSPYRPGGGFMNGYQGNLAKHLQQQFSNKSNNGSSSIGYSNTPSGSSTKASSTSRRPSQPSAYGSHSMSNGMSSGQNLSGQQQIPQSTQTKRELVDIPRYPPAKPRLPSPPQSQMQPHPYEKWHEHYHLPLPPIQRPSVLLQPPPDYDQYHRHGIPRVGNPDLAGKPLPGLAQSIQHHAQSMHNSSHAEPVRPAIAPPVQHHTLSKPSSSNSESTRPALVSSAQTYGKDKGPYSSSAKPMAPGSAQGQSHGKASAIYSAPAKPVLAPPAQQQAHGMTKSNYQPSARPGMTAPVHTPAYGMRNNYSTLASPIQPQGHGLVNGSYSVSPKPIMAAPTQNNAQSMPKSTQSASTNPAMARTAHSTNSASPMPIMARPAQSTPSAVPNGSHRISTQPGQTGLYQNHQSPPLQSPMQHYSYGMAPNGYSNPQQPSYQGYGYPQNGHAAPSQVLTPAMQQYMHNTQYRSQSPALYQQEHKPMDTQYQNSPPALYQQENKSMMTQYQNSPPALYHQEGKPVSAQYQNTSPVSYQQENNTMYSHQQYFQKPETQTPSYAPQYAQNSVGQNNQQQSQTQSYSTPRTEHRQVIDVPVDSTSIVERMMKQLAEAKPNILDSWAGGR